MTVPRSQTAKRPVTLDIPPYLHVLTGHYMCGPGYTSKRLGGTKDWLLIVTLAGEGYFGTDDRQLLVRKRDCVLIRPDISHDFGSIAQIAGEVGLETVYFSMWFKHQTGSARAHTATNGAGRRA